MQERCLYTVRRQRVYIKHLEEENYLLKLAATEWASRYYELINSINSAKEEKSNGSNDTNM